MPATTETAVVSETIRDALLARFDAKFARPEVRARWLAELAPAVFTSMIQDTAAILFAESFDLDTDEGAPPGLVPHRGPARAGIARLRVYAETLTASAGCSN